MGNVANLRNRQVKGNGKVKFLDKIYIIDIDEKMIDSLMKYFQWETNVELCCCDIESFLKDHIEKNRRSDKCGKFIWNNGWRA